MRTLGDVATGRDNNLNLVRAVAATAVLVSHAVPIALGPSATEPLYHAVGKSLGTLSVFIFFAISGYLITASFERSSSRCSFLLARGLRLFPGLFVNLVLVALVLGPLVTTLPVLAYLGDSAPYLFIARNMALFPLVFELPGVFQEQPFRAVVGSIWTLRHEVMCYAGVFIAGLFGAWHSRQRAAIVLGLYALAWILFAIADPDVTRMFKPLHELSLAFAIGTAFYIWRDRLPLNLVGVAVLLGMTVLLRGTGAYVPALILTLSYATFWVGYVPGGWLRLYNRLGDYSYGIYVYAFPLQGLAVYLFGPQSPLENVLYSLPMTLVCSVLSWHLVEKPAMALKPRLLSCFRLRRRLGRSPAPRVRLNRSTT